MEGSELLAYGFQRPQDAQPLPRVAILGAWGLSLNKRFGGVTPRQNRKYVHICIACQTEFLIVLKQYSDCLRRFSKSLLKDMVEI